MRRLTWTWNWLLLIWIVFLQTTNATAHLSGPLHPSRKDRLLHQVLTWIELRQVQWTPKTSESAEVSLSWSETSIWLEGSDFDHAVERLHSLYRQELQTRHVPGKSQAGCLAGLRRKTNKSNWGQVQAEARQRLTGQRLEEWQQYEFAATHEKRRRRRPRRSRSPRPAA